MNAPPARDPQSPPHLAAPAHGARQAAGGFELFEGGPSRWRSVTALLVAANATVFVVMLGFGAGLWHAPIDVQLAWGANFGPATQDGAWWRLFTAMFLHFGVLHLAMNLWALWDAGPLVERLYGRWRFALVYVASGVAGNLLSLVQHGSDAVSGGASGAIFGIYGALLLCLVHERRHIHPIDFRWVFGAALLFSTASLVAGAFVRGIDNAAHLGGLAAGTLLGALLLRPLSIADPAPMRLRALAAVALLAGAAALLLRIPEPRYRLGQELAARAAIRSFVDADRRLGQRWESIVHGATDDGASFEALAGRIDQDIARSYLQSFDELAAVQLSPGAPSAATLEALRRYSLRRGDASHALAEALRSGDGERVRAALQALQQATDEARAALPPPAPAAGAASAPASAARVPRSR